MARSFCRRVSRKTHAVLLKKEGALEERCISALAEFPAHLCQGLKSTGTPACSSRALCNWTTSNARTMQTKIETVVSFDVCD